MAEGKMLHKEGTEWPIEKDGRFEQSSCVKILVKNLLKAVTWPYKHQAQIGYHHCHAVSIQALICSSGYSHDSRSFKSTRRD